MKTPILHIAFTICTCALLASCSAQQTPNIVPVAEEQSVGFSVDAATRTGIISASEIPSLGVFGYSTGTTLFDAVALPYNPNLFDNRKVTVVDNAWNYGSPNVYWPVDLSINNTFLAYAPHVSDFPATSETIVLNTSTSYPTLTYTLPTITSQQVDVLYATPVKNINRKVNTLSTVSYTMKHATSWIAFLIAPQAHGLDPDESYTLNSLFFSATNLTMRATLNIGTGAWTGIGSSTGLFAIPVDTNPIPVGKIVPAQMGNNHLMLLPTTLLSKQDNDPMIYISFRHDAGDGTTDNSEYTFSVPFPETRLSAGGMVTYVLRISIEGVTVKFYSENTIDEWIVNPYPGELEVF